MSGSCEITDTFPTEPFLGDPPFQTTRIISWMHRVPPRYGKPSSLTSFLLDDSTSNNDRQDYLRGLLATSITIFALFFIWISLLIAFRYCLGPYSSIGWLSGSQIPLKAKPVAEDYFLDQNHHHDDDDDDNNDNDGEKDDMNPPPGEEPDNDPTSSVIMVEENSQNGRTTTTQSSSQQHHNRRHRHRQKPPPKRQVSHDDMQAFEKDLEEWNQLYQRRNKRMNAWRVVVLLAGLCIIVCSILMSAMGVRSLVQSVDKGVDTVGLANGLLLGGIDLVDTVLKTGNQTQAKLATLVDNVNTICPDIQDPICTNLWDMTPGVATVCQVDELFDGPALKEFLLFAVKNQSWTSTNFYQELLSAKQDLQDFVTLTEELQSAGDNFNWALYCAMGFSLLLAVLCMAFMAGAVLELPRVAKWISSVLFVPLFGLLVILSWILSMVFVIGSMALADLCVDSPDDKILILLDQLRLSPLVERMTRFYISGCSPDILPTKLVTFIRFLSIAIEKLDDLAETVGTSLQNVVCETEQTTLVTTQALGTSAEVCAVATLLEETRSFFECANWYPLYSNTVYSAMCYSGTDGFAWVTVTQFVIVFMAMIILTFRIVFYEIAIEKTSSTSKKRLSTTTPPQDSSVVVPPPADLPPNTMMPQDTSEMIHRHNKDGSSIAEDTYPVTAVTMESKAGAPHLGQATTNNYDSGEGSQIPSSVGQPAPGDDGASNWNPTMEHQETTTSMSSENDYQ